MRWVAIHRFEPQVLTATRLPVLSIGSHEVLVKLHGWLRHMENITERSANHGQIAYPSGIDDKSSLTMRKLVQHNSQNWRMPGTKLDGKFHGSILSAPAAARAHARLDKATRSRIAVATSKHCVE
jgi:hypothetical protein